MIAFLWVPDFFSLSFFAWVNIVFTASFPEFGWKCSVSPKAFIAP